MTDRELLELAAKAAGMWKESFSLNDDDFPDFHDERGFRLAWGKGWWNPLTDDGDALRLAVKLRMEINQHSNGVSAYSPKMSTNASEIFSVDADPYAATRRAIVLVAAEIGKGLAPFPTADEIRENWL